MVVLHNSHPRFFHSTFVLEPFGKLHGATDCSFKPKVPSRSRILRILGP